MGAILQRELGNKRYIVFLKVFVLVPFKVIVVSSSHKTERRFVQQAISANIDVKRSADFFENYQKNFGHTSGLVH